MSFIVWIATLESYETFVSWRLVVKAFWAVMRLKQKAVLKMAILILHCCVTYAPQFEPILKWFKATKNENAFWYLHRKLIKWIYSCSLMFFKRTITGKKSKIDWIGPRRSKKVHLPWCANLSAFIFLKCFRKLYYFFPSVLFNIFK